MVIGTSNTARGLTGAEVRQILAEGLAHLDISGKRVLVIIPDGTRTAPIPLIYRLLHEIVGERAAALDFLVALGTHPPMDDVALTGLLGAQVRAGSTGRSRIFNHRWDLPETFVTLGTVPAAEVAATTDGRLEIDVAVRLNRLVCGPCGQSPYDQLIVVGPVFPHEVAGFSGGNKYFVPGVAGAEIIDVTHWLGALMTSREIIGLAVMGQILVLNMDDHGFTVAVFNRTTATVDEFVNGNAKGTKVIGAHSVEELVGVLKRPRRVMLLVKAGQPVDDFIELLLPLLQPGDIIIDGGNSNYYDRMHRVFADWNEGELDSYLIEITWDILGYRDENGEPLVDFILDTAGQKGTGKWTAMSALVFFDGYRHERLPANLLQAQRDFFGAHTYERVDRPRGEFSHTDWTGRGGDVTARTYQA